MGLFLLWKGMIVAGGLRFDRWHMSDNKPCFFPLDADMCPLSTRRGRTIA